MEKIKDIMYDISDIVISLIIVTVIFFVISWKLNESLPISYEPTNTNVATKSEEPNSTDNKISGIEEAVTDTTPEVIFTEEERPVENNTGSTVSTEVVETPEVVPAPVETPAPTTPSGQAVIFVFSSGSTGFAIATPLKENGFLNDINGFISTVETMG